MYVHVGERDIFAEPEGSFSPYCFAVAMEVTLKYVFHNTGFSCILEYSAVWVCVELILLCKALLLLVKWMNCEVTDQ